MCRKEGTIGTDNSYSTWTSDRSRAGLEVELKLRIIFTINFLYHTTPTVIATYVQVTKNSAQHNVANVLWKINWPPAGS